MSKTYIDFFETLKGEFIASLKFKNKFLRLWGTTTIDDVEVLKRKFVVYPGLTTDNVKKFLKLIGSSKSFDGQSFKGVTSYYFYLNSTKADVLDAEDLADMIAGKINSYIGLDGEAIVTLTFTELDDNINFSLYTKEQILQYLISDYNTNFNKLHSAVGDYIIESAIGEYLLFDNGQHLTAEVLNASVTSVPYYEYNAESLYKYNKDKVARFKSSVSIQIKFIQKSYISGSSNIVNGIINERKEENDAKLQSLLESQSNGDSSIDWIGTSQSPKTDDIWYKGYLRKSFLDDVSIKTKIKCQVITSSLDTGYTQKKTKWWKKILGPVLIVFAIIAAIIPGGQPLAVVLYNLALYVGIATLVMVGLQTYWAKHGDPGAAQYMGRWVKIGSIISTIAGIGSIIANMSRMAFQQAATEAAKQSMIQGGATAAEATIAVGTMDAAQISAFNAAANVTVEVGVGAYASAAKEMLFSSVTSSWQSMISTGMKVFKVAIDYITKNRIETAQSETNSIVEQAEKVNEELADLQDKEINIGLENIKTYTNQLTVDNVRFQVDYLYEGTKMNIGRPSFHTAKGHNIISNDIYDINKI